MKNKKILLSILVLALMFGFSFSVQAVTYSTQTFTAEAIFVKPQIFHTAVTNVSPVNRNLNIEVKVNFGVYTSSQVDLLYYFDGNPSNIETVSKSDVSNGQPFYIETGTFDTSHNSISYQIRAKLTNQDGAEFYAYWPEEQSASSDTFHTASISNSTSTVVGPDGGTVEIDNGDQGSGNTGAVIEPGTVDPGTEIIIGEISFDDLFGGFLPAAGVYKASSQTPLGVCVNIGYVLGQDVFNPPILFKISLGPDTTAKNFIVMYMTKEDVAARAFDKATRVRVEKLDLDERLIYVKAAKEGYYLVIEVSDSGNKDYRPAKRVRVKSRIATYGGFKFNNLTDGDVVKIYNVSGKKVAELNAPEGTEGFEWRGREGTNNSGDWAKSGTYIYQIKLKEKSKVISGTIAFVW